MGFKIAGNGSYQNTKIRQNEELVPYNKCEIFINVDEGYAVVDNIKDNIDLLALDGVYVVVGFGKFSNTQIFFNNDLLRGIQNLYIKLEKNQHSMFIITGILLPNVIDIGE